MDLERNGSVKGAGRGLAKIAYLGPKGSFTEAAAKALIPNGKHIPYKTIPDSIDAVQNEEVDFAVVPLENAIEGSVNITLDYIIHHQRVKMVGEITAPIHQHLMVKEQFAKNWQEITTIYSHPQAIAQCHQFLRKHLPNATHKYMSSTSEAAEFLMNTDGKPYGVIANEICAKEYGLVIVQSNINDYMNNRTRFVALTRNDSPHSFDHHLDVPYKTTLMVTLPSDYSGALHQVLSAFAWRKINLSKIESRPMKTGLGNYFFIIDADMKLDDVLLPGVRDELQALGCTVELLGSYPCFEWEKIYSEATERTDAQERI